MANIHKENLTEEKSISEEVKQLTDYIINFILNDSVHVQGNFNEKDILYKENIIKCHFPQDLQTKEITLHYVIYTVPKDLNVETMHKYVETADCEYDVVSREMLIIGFEKNGYLNQDFYGDVMHEVTHMFQYDKGMQKRVDLYDSVIKMFRNKHKTENEHWISSGLYFTFTHEQDAFAHQFYGELKEMPSNVSYNDGLKNFQPYVNFQFILGKIKEKHNQQDFQGAIEKLGFDNRTFMQRIQFGWQRLKRKLANAYSLYKKELNENYKWGQDISLTKFNFTNNMVKRIEEHKKLRKVTVQYNDLINIMTESVKKIILNEEDGEKCLDK